MAAQQVARFVEVQSSIESLRNRFQELLMHAPGFAEFCGHQHQIQSGRYSGSAELRRLLEMPVGGYHGTTWEQANEARATDAVARARDAMDQAERQELVFSSTKAAIEELKEYGAPSYSWWTHATQGELLLELRQRLVKLEQTQQGGD